MSGRFKVTTTFGRRAAAWLLLACAFPLVSNAATTVENIRIWSEGEKTRVVLDLSRPVDHSIFTLRGPDRLVIDLKDGRLGDRLAKLPTGAGAISAVRAGVRANDDLRVVLDLNQAVRSRSFTVAPNQQFGHRLVVDLQRNSGVQTVKRANNADQPGRDIVIAIDPGHGGHDPGAIGKARTREKDVVLAISRVLRDRINAEPGMRAILIRDDDTYVDHIDRMRVARKAKADLFVSVHADAVDDRRPFGTSVYTLSVEGASDEAARQLAARENEAVGGVALDKVEDDVAWMLIDLTQSAAIAASLDVGDHVIGQLARIGKVHKRKVQNADFLVLKSPDRPSILVETGFISNPSEERRLKDRAHQRRLADALLAGIRNYFYENPPSDTLIARQQRRQPPQQVRHVITRGDTLSQIAERYNVSTSALKRANRMSSDRIRVGQTLSIPVSSGG